MKKGMVLTGIGESDSFEELLGRYKAAGFEGVEISISETGGWISLDSTEEDLVALKQKADNAGVEIHSIMGGLLWRNPLSDPDAKVRERGMMVVEKALEAGAIVGATAVLVVPGVVNETVCYEEAYDRSQAAIKELVPKAAEQRVVMAVENVWNKFLLSPREMVQYIDEIGSEWVGAYFDVGNIILYGYPEHWIRSLGGRLRKVHLKDYGRNGFTYLLQGDVNWPAVRAALEEIGYEDYVTAELGPYQYFPEVMLQHTSSSIDAILGK
jgi:L-ribulose-5-phosphate 3-epimerase